MVRDNKVSSQDTEAEKLKFAVRSTRINKMVQRRETAAYLKVSLTHLLTHLLTYSPTHLLTQGRA